MTLFPTEKTLKKWISLVPETGDLVFFKDQRHAEEFQNLGVPIFTRFEAWEQSADLMGLNHRSWYGYVLGRAAACAKLPSGLIESLHPKMRFNIFRQQQKLKLPTLLEITSTNGLCKLRFPKFETQLWVTAASWKKSTTPEKIKILKAYYQQNPRIEKYKPINTLTDAAKRVLKKHQLEKLPNTFAAMSGPNCLGFVARAISPHSDTLAQIWLHWPPLKRFLETQGFRHDLETKTPQSGDILVFMRQGTAVHACITLDSKLVMEKSGQDFYEPYLITTLRKTRASWPDASLHIWRKFKF